jgi:hypothetical protein
VPERSAVQEFWVSVPMACVTSQRAPLNSKPLLLLMGKGMPRGEGPHIGCLGSQHCHKHKVPWLSDFKFPLWTHTTRQLSWLPSSTGDY